MRTYGRVYAEDGSYTWQEVTTDASGQNDAVYLTTLIQVLKLNLGESPFWANFGIPIQQTIVNQLVPDFYVTAIQGQFAPFFSKLVITRQSSFPPTYLIQAMTHNGATLEVPVAV